MNEHFQLLNVLFQMIVADQAGVHLPETFIAQNDYARKAFEMLGEQAAKICKISHGDQHQTMFALAKLFTSGLIGLERGIDGEVRVIPVKEPDLELLQNFNDNIRKDI